MHRTRAPSLVPALPNADPVRVVFLSSSDPLDIRSFSTVLFHMVAALRGEFPDMEVVRQSRPAWFEKVQRRIRHHSGGRIDPYYWRFLNRWFAGRLARSWRERRTVVIGVVNATLIAELARMVPTINVTDSTFDLMRGFYAHFTGYDAATARAGERTERESIVRSVHNSFSSTWAARSAVETYGAAPEDVSVIAWGCNMPAVAAADARLDRGDGCRLLFIGGDWERKGGDIALETFQILRARGMPVTIDLVGARAPDGADRGEGINPHGFLSKLEADDAARLAALNREADFLFLPTRQDCTPMVFAEANAFGTPGMTRDVGGVGSVVQDDVNGCLLPADATAADFADRIERVWRDAEGYRQLRARSRHIYETRLNWAVWAKEMKQVIQRLAKDGRI